MIRATCSIMHGRTNHTGERWMEIYVLAALFAEILPGKRKKLRSERDSRTYQPSDKQSNSIVQVELRTLAASKIQIPAFGDRIVKPWCPPICICIWRSTMSELKITIWDLRREWSLRWRGPWVYRCVPCHSAGKERLSTWRAHGARAENLCHQDELINSKKSDNRQKGENKNICL